MHDLLADIDLNYRRTRTTDMQINFNGQSQAGIAPYKMGTFQMCTCRTMWLNLLKTLSISLIYINYISFESILHVP